MAYIKVRVESPKVMKTRGSTCQKGIMRIGISFFKSMRAIWVILSPLEMAHRSICTLIDLKRKIMGAFI